MYMKNVSVSFYDMCADICMYMCVYYVRTHLYAHRGIACTGIEVNIYISIGNLESKSQ